MILRFKRQRYKFIEMNLLMGWCEAIGREPLHIFKEIKNCEVFQKISKQPEKLCAEKLNLGRNPKVSIK